MGFFNYLVLHRRYNIRKNDLVADIGAGNNPILRANILVDKYTDTDAERYSGIVIDRPFVNADGEKLPFKDKSIDFIYCSHVLEHIPNPESFLMELERVGKRGVIITPHGDSEKLDPRKMHLWYIWNKNDKLIIKQKHQWNEYVELSRYYYKIISSKEYTKLCLKNWTLFNIVYYWEEKIDYEIIQDHDFDFSEFNMGFIEDNFVNKSRKKIPIKFQLKSLIGKLVRVVIIAKRR